MTVLDRMSSKGLVNRRKNGRAYLYTATLDLETARRNAVSRLAGRFFDNDPAALARYASRMRSEQIATPAVQERHRPRVVAREPAVLPSLIDDSLL
jgi:predicted transcriptional regulator